MHIRIACENHRTLILLTLLVYLLIWTISGREARGLEKSSSLSSGLKKLHANSPIDKQSLTRSVQHTKPYFRYASTASPCLWNQLRQPHSSLSVSDLPVPAPTTSSHSVNSPLSPSITPPLFHSRLKTHIFAKSCPPSSVKLTPQTISQWVTTCSWEGNRRSGIALAVHYRLQWSSHLWAQDLAREMCTPPTLMLGG